MGRRRMISVIGAGDASPRLSEAAEAIGRGAVDRGWRVLTGGRGGVMAAASRGARSSARWREGDVIGVLPGYDRGEANAWVDVCIPTGLGVARNVIVAASGDAVVAVGGGSGTLSEIALAWQLGQPVVALDLGEGWSAELGGRSLDGRRLDAVLRAESAEEALAALERLLG